MTSYLQLLFNPMRACGIISTEIHFIQGLTYARYLPTDLQMSNCVKNCFYLIVQIKHLIKDEDRQKTGILPASSVQ